MNNGISAAEVEARMQGLETDPNIEIAQETIRRCVNDLEGLGTVERLFALLRTNLEAEKTHAEGILDTLIVAQNKDSTDPFVVG